MAAGPYFREILNTLDEDVTINIADHDILEILVDYIYTGELTLKKVNVEDLLSAAIILKLDFVCAACAGVLHKHLNVSNCLGIRSVAKFNNFTDLLSISEEFIIKQFSKVIKSTEFLRLDGPSVVSLINDIAFPHEEKVYECIIKWVKFQSNDRKEFLPELMEHVHFLLLKPDILFNISKEPLLNNIPDIKDKIIEALYFNHQKSV
ncbi:kelch-like protein 20 [Acyrthosiphon pisum]|uniref:BTB domain-containing protein n=1 Tax=Acyrthosiphon pisum TaxID=7029 RepID=A0A8R2JVK3_ACYPI|nr:kelch-like protein 20 [Acyrthosiphon pisum]|eukprot:XP_016662783.1 PREDICTED: kelch-like protein 20 [Acyrthosiphon pisum]